MTGMKASRRRDGSQSAGDAAHWDRARSTRVRRATGRGRTAVDISRKARRAAPNGDLVVDAPNAGGVRTPPAERAGDEVDGDPPTARGFAVADDGAPNVGNASDPAAARGIRNLKNKI